MSYSKILAIYFDAPMQSYGVESRYDRRTTLSYPSRSAITGILCAAMGINRDDRVFLKKMADMTIETITLPRVVSNSDKNNVLSLKVSRFIDYHTVGAGYDQKSHKDHIPRKSDGKSSSNVQSYREYLTDSRFGVLFSGDDALVERCHTALLDPVWGVWFGRKTCIPASPLDQGIFDNQEEAIKKLCELAGCEKPARFIRDATFEEGEETIMDIPLTFNRSERGLGEQFAPRNIVTELE